MPDNTWALWDSPKKYSLPVSNEGKKAGTAIATGSGETGINTLNLPEQNEQRLKSLKQLLTQIITGQFARLMYPEKNRIKIVKEFLLTDVQLNYA